MWLCDGKPKAWFVAIERGDGRNDLLQCPD